MALRVPVRAIIPTAGFGTRLLPASKSVPKELLPVFDRPALQYAIDEALCAGIRHFGLVTLRGKTAIDDYFDFHPELDRYLRSRDQEAVAGELERLTEGLEFTAIRQPGPRGLGDAVLTARSLAGEGPFVVLLADEIVDQPQSLLTEMLELQAQLGGAVIALHEVPLEESSRYGMAAVEALPDGRFKVTGLVEKPRPEEAPSSFAAIGRYVLPQEIFNVLAQTPPGRGGEIQLTDGLDVLARQGRVHGILVRGRRFDVGSPLGLLAASLHFAWKRPELRPALQQLLAEPREEKS